MEATTPPPDDTERTEGEEDPLDLPCDDCGAAPGEECHIWCIGRPDA